MSRLTQGAILGNRYILERCIGAGAMAEVYRVCELGSGLRLAAKVMLPEHAIQPVMRARFELEGRAMIGIDHRHVLKVVDVGEDGGRPFLVMELAEGGSLKEWLEANGPMHPRLAVEVMIQVCKGVGAAHASGVIHRDIKPHNILISRRGVCKVSDFGIAQMHQSGGLTQTDMLMGTQGFMSPEQRTNPKFVDERSDVYALGATLFYVLTGRPPVDLFFAEQERGMLIGVHPGLVSVLLKSTCYRPAERFDNASMMARALHHARATLPAIDGPVPQLNPRERASYQPAPVSSRPPADSVPLGPHTLARTDHRPPTEPTPVARDTLPISLPEPSAGRLTEPVALAGGFLLVVIMAAVALAAWGAFTLRAAEDGFADSRRAFYDALHAERPVMDELERLGRPVAALRQQERALYLHRRDAERFAGARDYVHLLTKETEIVLVQGDPDRRRLASQVITRVSRVQERLLTHEQAMAVWQHRARAPDARLALALGLASGPPTPRQVSSARP